MPVFPYFLFFHCKFLWGLLICWNLTNKYLLTSFFDFDYKGCISLFKNTLTKSKRCYKRDGRGCTPLSRIGSFSL